MNPPVPVLLLTHNLGIGGSERQMTEVAKALDRRLFQPHVACFHTSGLRAVELRDSGVPVLRLPVTSFASLSALRGGWELIRYIRRNGIQLVHSFDVPLNIFAAPFAWLTRTPVVLTSQRAHRLLTPGLYHRLLRITDHFADGIVVNCEFMRQHLVEEERVPRGLIHLCYNGIDTSVFCPGPREPHPELIGASPVVGVVCALRPEKGLPILVRAFAQIAREYHAAKLVIVGSGPMLHELQNLASELQISKACLFVPATNDVVTWLRRMDVFVLPSLSEALSNSLMEAMACGCCIVASRVGGNPELTGESERGLLFEPGDVSSLGAVLQQIVEQPDVRIRLESAARNFLLAGFTIHESVECMQRIYSSLLNLPS